MKAVETNEKKQTAIPPVDAGGKSEAKADGITVVALEKGVYDNQRKNEGDVFTVKPRWILVDDKKVNYSAEEQIGKWMKKI